MLFTSFRINCQNILLLLNIFRKLCFITDESDIFVFSPFYSFLKFRNKINSQVHNLFVCFFRLKFTLKSTYCSKNHPTRNQTQLGSNRRHFSTKNFNTIWIFLHKRTSRHEFPELSRQQNKYTNEILNQWRHTY